MESESLSSKYEHVFKELKMMKPPLTNSKFQSIHKEFIELTELIESLNLYSDNESIDEISTSTLKYLNVGYEHAKFIDSYAVSSQQGVTMVNDDPGKRNK